MGRGEGGRGDFDSDEGKTRGKRTKEQVQAKNRNMYKPRTETRTIFNQTRRQAGGFGTLPGESQMLHLSTLIPLGKTRWTNGAIAQNLFWMLCKPCCKTFGVGLRHAERDLPYSRERWLCRLRNCPDAVSNLSPLSKLGPPMKTLWTIKTVCLWLQ